MDYGNIHPSERHIKGTEHAQLLERICKYEDTLIITLTEQQKEIFDRYKDCRSELSGITERDAFKDGFILAAHIKIEVMTGIETSKKYEKTILSAGNSCCERRL